MINELQGLLIKRIQPFLLRIYFRQQKYFVVAPDTTIPVLFKTC